MAGWHDARERLTGSCMRTRRGRHLRFQCTMGSGKALEKHSRHHAWPHVMAGCRPRADVRHAGARQPADLSPPPDLGWQCNLGCMQSEPRTGQRSSRPSQPSRPEYQPSYRYCCPANAASAEMHLGAGGVLGSLGQTRTCAKSTGAVSHASWLAICGNVSSARGAPMSYASTTQDAEGDERRRATVKRPGPGTACRQHLQAR